VFDHSSAVGGPGKIPVTRQTARFYVSTEPNHVAHIPLVSKRTTCCPRQLFVTLEFSSTAMSLCGLMCRVRCPDVSLCYDNSASQCPILCSIRWSCRWLCHVLTTATLHLQGRSVQSTSVSSQCSRQTEHVTPMLRDLHWLRSPERIDFKLAVLTYRSLHGLAPRYLSDFPTTSKASPFLTAAVSGRRHPRS